MIYAHRGASAFAPENTMAAFREALVQGADGIECDVQLTRDGIPVIIHDEFLERTTNGVGMVHEFTYDELNELDAGSWFNERFRGERIPTLAQLLRWVKETPLELNVEIKASLTENPRIEKIILGHLLEYDCMDRTVISSYDMRTLYQIRKIEPRVQTALLYFFLDEPWKHAKAIGAQALHAFYPFLYKETVLRSRMEGLEVVAYTVDDWPDINKMYRMQVDGIITNYPNRAKRLLQFAQYR
jgi:glycerophosphoryl diester phosphodiesterase